MRQNQAQRPRTDRSSGKRASAYRATSRRPQPRRVSPRRPRPERSARRRTAIAADRRSRRSLLFFVLVVSVAAQFTAVFADSGALVALFTLTGLLLSAVVIRAED